MQFFKVRSAMIVRPDGSIDSQLSLNADKSAVNPVKIGVRGLHADVMESWRNLGTRQLWAGFAAKCFKPVP